MSLAAGTTIGPYVVTARIGEGGMGEVYRAEDRELGRAVAIKALPDSVAHDAERVARFEREAKLLAALSHPHIAGIHGVERVGDTKFLVLELVEGRSLADELRAGPMSVLSALATGRQIAEALEAAHEKGIVHRDLKPANIMITADDRVKVLDFGLAKALDTEPAATSPDLSPTLTIGAATQIGVVLGTASYMAPEQAKGRPADKRSDLWAFGCVLYEMLAGTRAFQGDDISEILAAVIRGEPDWTRLPADMPPAVHRLLHRCLAKDRTARLSDASMARIEIDEALGRSAPVEATATVTTSRPATTISRGRLAMLVSLAAVAAAILSGFVVWMLTGSGAPVTLEVGRFAVTLEPGMELTASAVQRFVIARDGRQIIYNASTPSGTRTLYRRRVDQLESVVIRGAENAGSIFLSPDGEWIGYNDTVAGALRKVRIAGGAPVTITEARSATGGFRGTTWGEKGLIVFATAAAPGLMKVADTGGAPEPLTTPTDEVHIQPSFLPDGDVVLFTIVREGTAGQIAALSIATGEIRALIAGMSPHYAASGHLLFLRERSVWAVPFDASTLSVTGTAVPVLEGTGTAGTEATSLYDLAANGTLIYSPIGAAQASRSLVWVDRQGREQPVSGLPAGPYVYARLSPDGRYVALDTRGGVGDKISVWDLERSVLTVLTSGPGVSRNPVWAPNGRRVAFASTRDPPSAVYWQAADGTGGPERLTSDSNPQTPLSFTPDGTRLILREETKSSTASDLMLLTVSGSREKRPLVATDGVETNAEVFPRDGRWLAYQSGREVIVRSFPDIEGGRWTIGVGTQPLWSRDGRELFFLNETGRLMAVTVETTPTFSASTPRTVFDRAYLWSVVGLSARTYDISPDGRRFLMIKETATDRRNEIPQMVVVMNWFEELERLAPTRR